MQQCTGFSIAVHHDCFEPTGFFGLKRSGNKRTISIVHVAREIPSQPGPSRKAGNWRFVMDMSEMITGFLVALVITILVIDTVMDWRRPAQAKRQAAMAAVPGKHSLDPKIGCDIVWC